MTLQGLLKIAIIIWIGMMATSCSSTKKYGDRNSSYSKSRTSRSSHKKPKASNEDFLAVAETGNKIVPSKPINKKRTVKKNFFQDDDKSQEFRESIYETASQFLGLKYRSGGRSPSTGFDCSGFVTYVMGQNGVKLGGSSISMSKLGLEKKRENLQIGDLVFFGKNGNIHHVGIVSNNLSGEIEMIHSASSLGISIEIIDRSNYWNSRFMFGRDIISPFLNKPEKQE